MDTQQNIDALFAKAKLTPTAIPFSESKGLFIQGVEASASSPKGKGQFFNLKNILIMIGILGALSLAIGISISANKPSDIRSEVTKKQHVNSTINAAVEDESSNSNKVSAPPSSSENESWVDLLQTLPPKEIYLEKARALQDIRYSTPPKKADPLILPDKLKFPKLTKEEIAANHRQKKKMLKALRKFDRKKYAYVPSGSYLHEGIETSVQAFYMQRAEVTNLEYRTFLFDLLIQGRKNDFLTAAPDQTLWTKLLNDSLINFQHDYFSNELYNDHPVVNVSKKGAEMYCNWITIETNKTRGDDPMNDVRIPELSEWAYAASNLGKQKKYPWKGKSLTTDDIFNANFKLDEYKGDLKSIKQKTKSKREVRTTFEHTIGLMIAWTKSYEPNELGLYNMSGNVAEMVSMRMVPDSFRIEKPTKNQLVTCGGSWMSPIEDLKIFNERVTDNVNGHPSIGFRVVITHFNPVN